MRPTQGCTAAERVHWGSGVRRKPVLFLPRVGDPARNASEMNLVQRQVRGRPDRSSERSRFGWHPCWFVRGSPPCRARRHHHQHAYLGGDPPGVRCGGRRPSLQLPGRRADPDGSTSPRMARCWCPHERQVRGRSQRRSAGTRAGSYLAALLGPRAATSTGLHPCPYNHACVGSGVAREGPAVQRPDDRSDPLIHVAPCTCQRQGKAAGAPLGAEHLLPRVHSGRVVQAHTYARRTRVPKSYRAWW